MKSHLLIVNPNAGQGLAQDALHTAAEARPWLDVYRSSSAEDAQARARRACDAGVDVIGIGGGDGTVHDVVSAIADRDAPPLAVVPLGTANDMAKTLGVPLDDPGAAIDVMREGRAAAIDLARMTDADGTRWMVNAASAGFTEAVEQALDDEVKARWRAMAYLRATLEVLPELTATDVTIHVDDTPHTLRVCALLVANGRHAGGVEFAPRTSADDGALDVLAVTTDIVV